MKVGEEDIVDTQIASTLKLLGLAGDEYKDRMK